MGIADQISTEATALQQRWDTEERWRGVAHVTGQALARDGFCEHVDAEPSLLFRCGPEPGQRVLGVAAVAEERPQEAAILLHDVDLGVEHCAQARPEGGAIHVLVNLFDPRAVGGNAGDTLVIHATGEWRSLHGL